MGADPCSWGWTGVECDEADQQVLGLHLGDIEAIGGSPNWTALAAGLPALRTLEPPVRVLRIRRMW